MRKGIYYLRKSLNDFLKIIINSFVTHSYIITCVWKRKNKTNIFSFQSMSFLIFAKVQFKVLKHK
jgi:hypothetical protein